MSQTMEAVFRFSIAAHAADLTPKSLRNWMSRRQVRLSFSRDRADMYGWREFSYVDILTLALIRILVDFGVSLSSADDTAFQMLHKVIGHTRYLKNVPPIAVAEAFSGTRLVVWRNNGFHTYAVQGSRQHIDPKSRAFLVIDAHGVAMDTIERLKEAPIDAG